MFESVRKLIAEIGENPHHGGRFDENDYRLAAAALLVHAAAIDGAISEAGRAKLHDLVKLRFNLDDADADELIAEATAAEQQSIDLYRFTSQINRALDEKGRARLVEMMWQIVCADGVISEFEDNLIWRAADLLGISRDERIALRGRVTANGKPDERA
jgi:uncharacterized tellurite resistance protein B-like protein